MNTCEQSETNKMPVRLIYARSLDDQQTCSNESGDLKLMEMGTELVVDALSDARGFINVLLSLSDCTLVCRTLENLSIDEFVERNPERTCPI